MTADTQAGAAQLPNRPAAKSRPSTAALPKKLELSVVVLDRVADLQPYLSAWDDLADNALEPNVFYESWMLRPALEHLADGQELLFVLVVAQLPQGPLLCGFFPLQRQRRYKGLPVGCLRLWRYIHCYLCTPLLRATYAAATLAAFFDWLGRDRRAAPLLEWQWVSGDGPFHRLLLEYLGEKGKPVLLEESYARALLRPRPTAQEYIDEVLSGDRRRNLRRNEKCLRQVGQVSYVRLQSEAEVERWLDDFLRLETSGWKGKEGTALGCHESERRFFLAAMLEAFRRGRLLMMALELNGRPIALSSDLFAAEGASIFKVAFDEQYKSFAPGILLEVEKIRVHHELPNLRWVDSCNKPGPSVLKELHSDRRLIQTLLLAPGKAPGPLVLALLPLLRWLRRKVVALAGLVRPRRRKGESS